jgi:predicted nucleic acid-binding protein
MDATRAVVCDASVLAAIAFEEPNSAEARALTRSKRLLAPSLLRYEMAQVVVSKCIRSPNDASGIGRAFAASLRVPVRLLLPSWPAVVELARKHKLSAYHAAYLQLAKELHIPLATLDARLGRVAADLGIKAAPRAN